jgi:hypothetical protein
MCRELIRLRFDTEAWLTGRLRSIEQRTQRSLVRRGRFRLTLTHRAAGIDMGMTLGYTGIHSAKEEAAGGPNFRRGS